MALQSFVRSNPLQRVQPAANRLKPVTTNARNSRGFTLLEMMIVIAIMLLLVIATLPRLKQALDESKLRESSRQLSSHFSLAKARAASTGRPCGLWFVAEPVGDPTATPGLFQTTQLYLAEVPPPYSGDFLESRVVVTDSSGNALATLNNGPNWLLNFTVSFPGSLTTLVNPGDNFGIRFDHKGPIFTGWRDPNSGQFYVISSYTTLSPNVPIVPPTGNGLYDATNNPNAGYQYEIFRNPQRIGALLSLPRGTCVDLTYSGFGNTGVNFSVDFNPQPWVAANLTQPAVLLMFAPDGHIGSVSYRTWDLTNSMYRFVTNDAQGTAHFLVGRPEKVLNATNPLGPNTNFLDNNSLWVSVGRLSGSVTTTDNGYTDNPTQLQLDNPNVNLGNLQFADYLFSARKYAREQDVKGGR